MCSAVVNTDYTSRRSYKMTTSKKNTNVKAQASKAQAQAQVGAQAQKRTRKSAKAQAKAYKYAVVGTYTYDGGKNNGKTVPCVDVATQRTRTRA